MSSILTGHPHFCSLVFSVKIQGERGLCNILFTQFNNYNKKRFLTPGPSTISTPTKPSELIPRGAEGVQLHASVTAKAVFYAKLTAIQILDFICRVAIPSELNITFENNLRI